MKSKNSPLVGIHHVGIMSAQADATIEFYKSAAGFNVLDIEPLLALPSLSNGAGGGGAFMRGPNAYLRVLNNPLCVAPRTSPAARRPVSLAGVTHVCLQSTRMDTMCEQFESAGATFHAQPVDLGTGFLYAYVRDGDANVIELEGVAPVWDDPTAWIAHVSFTSTNVDRLSDFYSTILDQTVIKSKPVGPSQKIDAISGLKGCMDSSGQHASRSNPTFQPASTAHTRSPDESGYAYVCFETSNLGEAVLKLLDAGATQSSAQADLSGPGHYFCSDPDGNWLLLLSFEFADQKLSISELPDPTIVARMAAQREILNQKALSK
ncbi:MAG: VOC family protein [Rhodocyclaceae bacterium]|nr:VOC family protein [Rhodocyclaceae bacterium]